MKVGDVLETQQRVCWQECEMCGKPAKFRRTYLLENYRINPASKGYGRDDCSWCSDLDVYLCGICEKTNNYNPPYGYARGYSQFPLAKFKHMGFYKMELR